MFNCQGLSNRKVGATSMNSKSSRSHIVFTFIVESWCKVSSIILLSLLLHIHVDIYIYFYATNVNCVLIELFLLLCAPGRKHHQSVSVVRRQAESVLLILLEWTEISLMMWGNRVQRKENM